MSAYTHLALFFFFNDTATTEIYTLSLHDALPIFHLARGNDAVMRRGLENVLRAAVAHRVSRFVHISSVAVYGSQDRKSTRLNSSHSQISYAVFCLKKKTGLINVPMRRVSVIARER